jgi:hypothetical protein
MDVQRDIEAHPYNNCCRGKAVVLHILSVCLKDAVRMCRIILSSVAWRTLQYFSTLSHKRNDFRKRKFIEYKKYIFWFSPQILSETFLILRIIEPDMRDFRLPQRSREICALLSCYATSIGNFLSTFRNKQSVPSSRVKILGFLTLGLWEQWCRNK